MVKHILTTLLLFTGLLSNAQTITFSTPPELCANETTKNLTSFMAANPSGGKWLCVNCTDFNPIANDSITFNPQAKATGFNYELRYKYNNDSGTINLKVNPLPNVTAGANDYNACESDSAVILTSSPTGGEWSGPGTNGAQNIFNATKTGITKNANNKILYTYKDPNTGCQSKDSIEIYVQKAPTIGINNNDTVYELCEGGIFNLKATMQNASTMYWYTIDGDYNNIQPDLFSSMVTYTPNNDDNDRGTVKMYAETIPFAGDQCPAALDSISLKILEIPNARLEVDSGCETFTASLVTTLDNKKLKENEVSYTWDFGDGSTENSQSNTVFHTYVGAGRMKPTVIVNNKDLCFDTVSATAMVYEKPNAAFVVIPADLTTTILKPVFTFNNITTGGDKPYTNTWNYSDNSGNEVNPENKAGIHTHKFLYTTVADSGNRYNVKLLVTTATGCIAEFNTMVRINPAGNSTAYPNPAKDEVTIDRQSTGNIDVSIISPEGRVIRDVTWVEEYGQLTIKRGGLSPGIYYIIITDSEGNQRKEKVIFE